MKIYFAVNDHLINKYKMPERFQEPKTFEYEVSDGNILASIIGADAGSVLNNVSKWVDKPFAICAAIVSDKDAVEALRAGVVGDVVHLTVIITEITWVK